MFILRVDEDIDLRLTDAYHLDAYYDLIVRNREHLNQWMDWADTHQTVEDTFSFMLFVREQFANRKAITVQIYYQDQIAGSINLMIRSWQSGFCEIGYWLGQSFTGQGIITRSARAFVNFAFNTLKMHKVIIRAIKENEASLAVAKRLGFAYEGLQIQQRLLRGEYHDHAVYYMLRKNWKDTTTSEFTHRIDEHIELRPFMTHHAEEAFTLIDNNRQSLRKWLNWVDDHESIDDTRRFIKTAYEHYGDYDGLDAGIWYDGRFCGQVSINSWSLKNYKGDIGYWLAEPYTGKGIMTQSVRAIIDYAFDVIQLHRLELLCAVPNTRSCAVAERLNFTHEGVLRRGERIRNHYLDVNVYAILKPDWKA